MPEDSSDGHDGTDPANAALADEIEALNSIYGPDTLILHDTPPSEPTTAVLRFPHSTISFLVSFPATYPDEIPRILGTESTGESSKIGEGEEAVELVRKILERVFVKRQVCFFDVLEEGGSLGLNREKGEGEGQDEAHGDVYGKVAARRSEHATREEDGDIRPASSAPLDAHDAGEPTHALKKNENTASNTICRTAPATSPSISSSDATAPALSSSLRDEGASASLDPKWTLSAPLTVSKSTFLARACVVNSLAEAQSALSTLLASNKKVRDATHNISAWRIKTVGLKEQDKPGHGIVIQDCDDDGESAAGGRLLHLMQLMDVWNVLVVVSRWYGGVKLGADRFRCINSVGREALVLRGWVPDSKEKEDGKSRGKGKSKGKR